MKTLLNVLLIGILSLSIVSCTEGPIDYNTPLMQAENSDLFVLQASNESSLYEATRIPQSKWESYAHEGFPHAQTRNGHSTETKNEMVDMVSLTFLGASTSETSFSEVQLRLANGSESGEVRIETTCIKDLGKETLYGGLITEASGHIFSQSSLSPIPSSPCRPFAPGTHVYFKLPKTSSSKQAVAAPQMPHPIFLVNTCNETPDCFAKLPAWYKAPMSEIEKAETNIKENMSTY